MEQRRAPHSPRRSRWHAPGGRPPEVGLPPAEVARVFADQRRGTWPPPFPLALQPLVLANAAFHELLRATADLVALLRKAAWHCGSDRDARIAALGIDPAGLPFFVADEDFEWRHCADLARADVVIGRDGPKFVEVNVSGAIGGMADCAFFLRGWRAVADRAGVAPFLGVDIWSRLAALVERTCAELGVLPSAVLVDHPSFVDRATTADTLRWQVDGLRAHGIRARHVEPADLLAEIGLPGPLREPLGLAEFDQDDAKASGCDLTPVRAALDAGLVLVPTQTARLLHSKKTLARLSEGQPWMDAAERAFVDRYVPWTRVVGDRPVSWRGQRHDLPRLLLERREAFVLKGSMGCAGREVAFGARTEPTAWAALVASAVETGYAVAQEVVEADPVPVDVLAESGEITRLAANAVVSPFCAGGAPAGCLARFLPAGPPGLVRRADGAVLGCAMGSG
ncbi:hypothetical protein [Actinokineospora sp. NPDC004072]